jgi:hypothetical protein
MRVPGAQFSSCYQDVCAFSRILRHVCAVVDRGVSVTESLTVYPLEVVLVTNEAAVVRSISHTVILYC